MEDKQMINEVLNSQMKNLERQYQEIRLEEKELIESTRRRIISNQAKLQEEYLIFDKIELTNMWIFETPPLEAAKQYILDNFWSEAVGVEDLGVAYYP